MVSHRFDYTTFRNHKAPVIPIDVWGGGRWHNVWAYVDSGASFSVFHTREAKRLGVRLATCKRFTIVSAAGRRVPVYQSRRTMRVGGVRFRANIGFCKDLGGTFNLLGREGVFSRFLVCFDDKNETVTFMENVPKRRVK